ncbi:MAG TPA: hypothetical protein VHO06_01185 [Polyangia bacterium]|nr:hypothetical protein [Polyangia bacterium]
MKEAGPPQSHRYRQKPNDRDDTPAYPPRSQAEMNEYDAQRDPQPTTEGTLHELEDFVHRLFSVTDNCNGDAVVRSA